MTMPLVQAVSFPQFPQRKALISLFKDVPEENLKTIKEQLIQANPKYDYCFLNTKYIISLEQLQNSIHKSILHLEHNSMQAKTLNTEILLNLSPVNVISEAIKRFGISDDCSNVIVVKVVSSDEDIVTFKRELGDIVGGEGVAISDEVLLELVDVSKFKKIYKLNDAAFSSEENLQGQLTRLAIGACLLRGY
ncbi:CGI121 [Candida theae]|uniref:EKC/KEOPS complex subunit CGI121 n=1 Tax=Candida theae TaxID=1198502 RepID=A0AAD5FYH1_9ASCO|nr:CGI121 [Candida theae]KAI5957805.1 CGI121 [Candida theae]